MSLTVTDLKKLGSGNFSISVLIVQLESNCTQTDKIIFLEEKSPVDLRSSTTNEKLEQNKPKPTDIWVSWSCCWPAPAVLHLWYGLILWDGNEPEPAQRWESPPSPVWREWEEKEMFPVSHSRCLTNTGWTINYSERWLLSSPNPCNSSSVPVCQMRYLMLLCGWISTDGLHLLLSDFFFGFLTICLKFRALWFENNKCKM